MCLDGDIAMFKVAMRQLATTVSVVSTQHDGQRFGMTATAVASVSMDPPSLLICVNQNASIHVAVMGRKLFWLNVLHERQEDFCSVFSGAVTGERRFENGNWVTCEDGLPYLADAQANMLCQVEVEVPFGTHTIFVGKVLKTITHNDIRPLVYFRGGFADVQTRVGAAK